MMLLSGLLSHIHPEAALQQHSNAHTVSRPKILLS